MECGTRRAQIRGGRKRAGGRGEEAVAPEPERLWVEEGVGRGGGGGGGERAATWPVCPRGREPCRLSLVSRAGRSRLTLRWPGLCGH